MKKVFSAIVLTAFMACIFSACGKNNDSAPASFTWTVDGNTYTATTIGAFEQSMDLAPYFIGGMNGTMFNVSFTRQLSFSLTSFAEGNYTFTMTPGGNRMDYHDDQGYSRNAVGGSVTITSNSNSRLSGNFNATVNGPTGNVPITGSFSNVVIKP